MLGLDSACEQVGVPQPGRRTQPRGGGVFCRPPGVLDPSQCPYRAPSKPDLGGTDFSLALRRWSFLSGVLRQPRRAFPAKPLSCIIRPSEARTHLGFVGAWAVIGDYDPDSDQQCLSSRRFHRLGRWILNDPRMEFHQTGGGMPRGTQGFFSCAGESRLFAQASPSRSRKLRSAQSTRPVPQHAL